jgi:NAD(P)-dependent dehydrogenase (short-subunit alcohol dehydrogenase family)
VEGVPVTTAIVTGSESGIGRATAVALAQRGFDVGVTWFRSEDDGRATVGEIEALGRRAELRRLDLADSGSVQETIGELADALGGLDALVNNAGTMSGAPFLELGLDDWQKVIDVDLTGQFLAGQEAARRMAAAGRGGRIVNVTSVHEHVPLREAAPYCSAKGGLGLLTKCMALELAEHGITVSAVAPGEIATAMSGNEDRDPSAIERPMIPLGRPGDAREVAAFIAFLCSPEASYATGASYVVDGGLLLMAAVANQDASGRG